MVYTVMVYTAIAYSHGLYSYDRWSYGPNINSFADIFMAQINSYDTGMTL